jgi:gliding motility-associated lipoprotein GldD
MHGKYGTSKKRSMKQLSLVLIVILFYCFLSACGHSGGSPKPRGFYRLEFPEKAYRNYSATCPFSFDYPVYAQVVQDSSSDAEPCWLNMNFPQFQGILHMSYKAVANQKMFRQLTEDAHDFAYKHSVKATDIEEIPISDPANHVYGIFYQIDGNTASSAQFYLTDSGRHYLRGALYFSVEPRIDSIRPVLDFVKTDLDRMIKTFRWKN